MLHFLFWDTNDPYFYVRRQGDQLIVGGRDHRTGIGEESRHFEELEAWARERFTIRSIRHRWSGQVMEPVDGLPYIGAASRRQRFFFATGFAGNGMTFGTIAARILSDRVLGHHNSWASLCRLSPAEARSPEEIAPGEGKIMEWKDEKVAAFRDDSGDLHAVSSVCTHLGCQVVFNGAEKSWDCPCHGSRFGVDGEVMHGPAREPLAKVEVTVRTARREGRRPSRSPAPFRRHG